MTNRARQVLNAATALAVGAAVWLPILHLTLGPDTADYFADGEIPPSAGMLAARHIDMWKGRDAAELERMRLTNPEWDFMGRTFLVMALANMALRDPSSKDEVMPIMDLVIDDTLRLEREEGMHYFLLPYARSRRFEIDPPRSLFVDGEIALMLAHRIVVADRPDHRALLAERVQIMSERMRRSPVVSAESYPDECWTFCNTAALAAIRMADVLDGTDHSDLLEKWVETAKKKLVHPETGLLVSSYTLAGAHLDGPEGSSIWMASHCLGIVDQAFARDQYRRARKEIGGDLLGFGYSREWPRSWVGPQDVDSGPVIPILGASPGASGLALLGAATFDDRDFLTALLASLHAAAFPSVEHGGLRFKASNQVGDAVLFYATMQGPVWKRMGGSR